ncbi:MAG: hypothetical protein EHM65_00445 [Acidobacteriales bacterium]|nr:MAG: hypothetical protein EHM65_00445 [Terriglobales bacterium]
MKFVQIGILIALIVVGVLLFRVYTGQQQQMASAPAPQAMEPVAPAEPLAAPPAAVPAPVEKTAVKPSPVPREKRVAKSDAVPKPEPVASPPEPPATPAETAPLPPAEPAVAPAPAELPAPPAPPEPRQVTISAGTLVSVRLAETLASDKLQPGETFTATLDRPLVVDGLVIAERGARAEGRVVEAQDAGRLKGVASLSIQLVRLNTSDGQRLEIQTDAFHKAGETSKREDATKVGAGAGLGAVIGAIAGGGKGAAIGAAVGGAAGAGTVAATRGKPAVLPVETRIDFRISRPVVATEKQ